MEVQKIDLKRLKAERIAKGISQQKIAEFMGVSKSTISKWETGSAKLAINDFIKMVNFLGFTSGEISIFFTLLVPKREQMKGA
jgi:transcriptional regulator with XRE-family HTH domain